MSLCSDISLASLSKKNDGILNKGSPRVIPNLPSYDYRVVKGVGSKGRGFPNLP